MSFTKSVKTGSINIPFLWINNCILCVNIDAIVSIGSEMELKILEYTYYIELVHSHVGGIVCVFTGVCNIVDSIRDRVNGNTIKFIFADSIDQSNKDPIFRRPFVVVFFAFEKVHSELDMVFFYF